MVASMRVLTQIVLSFAGILAVPPAAPPARGIPSHGCPDGFLDQFDPGPVRAGPLSLSLIACLDFGPDASGHGDPILSPDGTSAARWAEGSPGPIGIAALESPGLVRVPNRVAFRNYAGMIGATDGAAPDAIAWAGDSQSLWTVRQRTMSPSGWSLAGLEPVSIGRDGAVRALPALHHPAGPLDAILWVGGDGLALAQFGARGSSYRPEHDDPAPTLAMVDAARGRVLASVPVLGIAGLRARLREQGLMTAVAGATATILPDGRIRAVVQFRRWGERPPGIAAGQNFEPIWHPGVWLVWTQGQPPRVWTAPYGEDRSNPLALSPDGSRLLVVRPLQPEGLQVSCRIPCRGPPPPPPTPVNGPVAELIELASQRVLWRVPARAVNFWAQNARPTISGDGRYALVQVPPEGGRLPIALIAMRDGRVLARFSPFQAGSYPQSFGFTADGRRVWLASGNIVFVYVLAGR